MEDGCKYSYNRFIKERRRIVARDASFSASPAQHVTQSSAGAGVEARQQPRTPPLYQLEGGGGGGASAAACAAALARAAFSISSRAILRFSISSWFVGDGSPPAAAGFAPSNSATGTKVNWAIIALRVAAEAWEQLHAAFPHLSQRPLPQSG